MLNYRILLQSIIVCISSSLLFSGSAASFAAESSIIPFQLSTDSMPMLHLGVLKDKTGIQPVSGIQIQPTSNLLLGGVLSPRNNNNDLSIYYHILVGYIPKWKLLKFSSNMIQVGMHRYRFGELRTLAGSVFQSWNLHELEA